MVMNPLVSIVLVNYNGMQDTIECIDSVLHNKYDNYNIVVVDNGSTKKEIFPSAYFDNPNIFFIQEENRGFAAGSNVGCRFAIERTGADYLLLLNNDTIVTDDFLVQLTDSLSREKDKAVVTGKIYYWYDKKRVWYAGGVIDLGKGLVQHVMKDDKSNAVASVGFASGCLMLIPKNVFNVFNALQPHLYEARKQTR